MARLLVPRHLQHLDRSTSKLTQLARRVAIPDGIVSTDWPEVSDVCRDDLGITFDGWQDGMGQLMLARDESGHLAHTVGGFHLSAMRQVGKTYFVAGAMFGLCKWIPDLLCIWTAHHSTTSDETFEAIQGFASRILVAPHIEKVYRGSGDQEVRFHNGSRILFGARERGFGRGVPGVDVIMSDEGQIMSEKAMEAQIATMNTSQLGLHIYAGTPPLREELHRAGNWMRSRAEAWVVKDPEIVQVYTEDSVWVEFGAEPGSDLDDLDAWAKNPSTPHRTPFISIQRLRKKLTDEGFRREGLGIYDEDNEESAFDMSKWETLEAAEAREPHRAALVLDVAPDWSWSSIGMAAELEGAAVTDLENDRTLVMVKSMEGTATAISTVKDLYATKDIFDIAITPWAAKALENHLIKAGFEYHIMSGSEVTAAYGTLKTAIRDATVAHMGQAELDFALQNTNKRMVSVGESESFDRRENTVDTSPAVAAACALYRHGQMNHPMPYLG